MRKLHFWPKVLGILMFLQVSFMASAQRENLKVTHPPVLKTFKQQRYRVNNGEMDAFLKVQLNLKNNDHLLKVNEWTDKLGYQHIKYQQEYKGVKVLKSTYSVHARNGFATAISGNFLEIKDLNIAPTVQKSAALKTAVNYIFSKKYKQLGKTELVISRDYIGRNEEPHLAYHIVLISEEPESHNEVIVDAHTGRVLLNNPLLRQCFVKGHKHHHKHKKAHKVKKTKAFASQGTGYTLYSGTQTIHTDPHNGGYRLFDDSRGNGIHIKNSNNNFNWDFNGATEFVDNDNNWTQAEWDNADKDAAGIEALWAYEKTYDYYAQFHNRNSLDNNGRLLRALVHSNNNWFNAQYSSAFVMMRFGDGSGNQSPLTTLDITTHELTHGVTDFTADLVYANESGALNESFSDIFAAAVEAWAAPSKATWLVGDDIGHIRDMENPNAKGHPDTYKGTNWFTGSGDFGGVHTNSAVLNHWFYLLSVGKSGTNDNGDAYTVNGISIEKAARIAYRMLTVYLNSSSNYAAARTAGIQSATDLFGAGSPEVIQTTNAFYAVGVGAEYGGGGNGGGCSTTVSSFPYSESFESGLGNWTNATGDDTNWTRDSGGTPSSNTGPSSGSNGSYYMYVEASNPNFPSKTAILESPCFDLSGVTNPELTFDYHMYGSQVNNLKAEVKVGSGSWTQIFTKSGNQGNNWLSETINLSAYLGTEVKVRFMVTTGTGSSGWQSDIAIDHVRVQAGGGTPPAPTYCASTSNNANDEYISRVRLGSIDNSSTASGGYSDYTSVSTDVNAGSSYTITINPTWTGTVYNEAYSVWIDFNQDGDFTDAGEQVFTQGNTTSATISGSISIPSSALSGATRMRVSMKYNGIPTSCETFSYGEVEDYTVTINGGTISSFGFDQQRQALENATSVYPNPARKSTNVQLMLQEEADVSMSLINAQGKIITTHTSHAGQGALLRKFDVSKLPAGIYLMRITKNGITTTKRFVVNNDK
ncbi:MAG TPA: hypothetical protein DCS93_12090 [Microscillaceae bacterium]|nr:hypothetical protein [Microscillaceae bacterium]